MKQLDCDLARAHALASTHSANACNLVKFGKVPPRDVGSDLCRPLLTPLPVAKSGQGEVANPLSMATMPTSDTVPIVVIFVFDPCQLDWHLGCACLVNICLEYICPISVQYLKISYHLIHVILLGSPYHPTWVRLDCTISGIDILYTKIALSSFSHHTSLLIW